MNGCSLGKPLSVILADIHMVRSENAVAHLLNQSLYKRFVNDIYTKRNKKTEDVLFIN